MKILVANHRVLMWLSLCPADESSSIKTKLLYSFVGLSLFITIVSFLVCSGVFFFKIIMIDLEEGLYAFAQIVAISSTTYMTITAFLLRDQINSIFKSLSTIYDESK